MEAEVVATIRAIEAGPDDVVIFAFDYNTVVIIGELAPGMPSVWLIDEPPTAGAALGEMVEKALRARATALGFSQRQVTSELVNSAHDVGLMTYVWTANEAEVMHRLIDIGVDVIITDHPDVLSELLGRPRR